MFFCLAIYVEFYSDIRPNPKISVTITLWPWKWKTMSSIKEKIFTYLAINILSLHLAFSPWDCNPTCFCSPRINGRAVRKTSSNMIISLVHCSMCCLRKPQKPENLWKATICVYHSYFMDNNSYFLLRKQQQAIAGKMSKSLKCLAVLFLWLCWRLSVEFKAVKHI